MTLKSRFTHYTPDTITFDFHGVLTEAAHLCDRTIDHDHAHRDLTQSVIGKEGLPYMIRILRECPVLQSDFPSIDESDLTVCDLLACFDEYSDDDDESRLAICQQVSSVFELSLFDVRTVAEFYYQKRR